ncbi:MAG: chorismate synthase [Anaerolineales bacterium]
MTLRFLTAGESHGPALMAILEGMPAGLSIDDEMINAELARRQRGYGAGPRMKIERDTVQILGGVLEGKTTGAPLAIQMNNRDHEKWDARPIEPFTTPRPGHADLTGTLKYGYDDLRPALERASARETAARVAIGAVCKILLSQFDIQIGGYVTAIGGVTATLDGIPLKDRPYLAEKNEVRCPDANAAERMKARIQQVMKERDTLGGIIEVVAYGLPVGLGSHVHWDRRLETRLGAAVLSVPAIKGVEFGSAFDNTRIPGTQVHDAIRLDGEVLIRPSNRAGGIEGGISNGQPLLLRAAMKPIATTLTPQETVDLATGEEVPTQYERSDFCPVPRAVPILEAMMAFVIADVLIEKLGGDTMNELKVRFRKLPRARLSDFSLDGVEHIFWPKGEFDDE